MSFKLLKKRPQFMRGDKVEAQLRSQNGGRKSKHGNWLILGVLFATLFVGTTFALMTVYMPEMINRFTFGDTTISIDEDFRGWELKTVALTNVAEEHSVPGAVRAMLVPVLKSTNDEGTPILVGGDLGPLTAPVGNKIIMGDLTFVLDSNWSTYWLYKEGYFYYKTVLPVGATTEPLLNKVSLTNYDAQTIAKYENIKIEVEVLADIIQAANGAPLEAWGVAIPV